jgi:hypothetical protein
MVGRLMARHTRVPVELPRTLHGIWPTNPYLQVEYGTGAGYCLSLGGGRGIPANSPREDVGNAQFMATVQGFSAHAAWPPKNTGTWIGPFAPTGWGPPRRVLIAPGIRGLVWHIAAGYWYQWHRGDWTFNSVTYLDDVTPPRQLALAARPARQGAGVFWLITSAPDVPSEATFVHDGVRYVINANQGEALALAHRMATIPAR